MVIDVPPPVHDQELAFWQAATGQPLTRIGQHPEYHGSALPGGHAALLIQRLGAGQARMHLDIHTDDLPADVARLEAAGARREAPARSWQVMRDPAGLPVLRGTRSARHAHRRQRPALGLTRASPAIGTHTARRVRHDPAARAADSKHLGRRPAAISGRSLTPHGGSRPQLPPSIASH